MPSISIANSKGIGKRAQTPATTSKPWCAPNRVRSGNCTDVSGEITEVF